MRERDLSLQHDQSMTKDRRHCLPLDTASLLYQWYESKAARTLGFTRRYEGRVLRMSGSRSALRAAHDGEEALQLKGLGFAGAARVSRRCACLPDSVHAPPRHRFVTTAKNYQEYAQCQTKSEPQISNRVNSQRN
jgi:hypothetical protein